MNPAYPVEDGECEWASECCGLSELQLAEERFERVAVNGPGVR